MTKINLNAPSSPILGIDPVVNEYTHTLILCAFPDRLSLNKKQYYETEHQLFWLIMESLLKTPLSELTYSQKLDILLKNGYGLWDVISFYEYITSLHTNQKNTKAIDATTLNLSNLKRIVLNGSVASRYQKKLNDLGYKTISLPSTNALYSKKTLQKKLTAWEQLTQMLF